MILPTLTTAYRDYRSSMEISSNRINLYQLSPPRLHDNGRVAAERHVVAGHDPAQNRNALSEYVSQGEVIRERRAPDYTGILQRTRLAQAIGTSGVGHSAAATLTAQRAVDTYRNLSLAQEDSSGELLPRVDDYA